MILLVVCFVRVFRYIFVTYPCLLGVLAPFESVRVMIGTKKLLDFHGKHQEEDNILLYYISCLLDSCDYDKARQNPRVRFASITL